MNKQTILEWAQSYQSHLVPEDKRLHRCISVQHQDGSNFSVSGAFLMHVLWNKRTWLVMFSRNHGHLIWPSEDIQDYSEYVRLCDSIETISLDEI